MLGGLEEGGRRGGGRGGARGLLAEGGSVIVVDERVAETFTAPGDTIERLMYGFSVLCCLPAGLADQPSAATGTVMRPATLRRYALEAGFRGVGNLPISSHPFRVYRVPVGRRGKPWPAPA